jgi:acyl-CoA synthetase (NDP forming)
MRILGPNIFGLYSARASLNAGFGPADIRPGKVAIITQSGAMGGAMIGKTAAEGIGLSAIVPLGNKADIDEADLLEYLRDDPETEIVLIYMEGVKQGQRLVRALDVTSRRKPVIVVKTGRSRRGALAAASHTGALAGADGVFDDLMRQCGVLRAERLEDALAWCRFFMDAPRPAGENVVIVTNGGGAGVAAADACEKYGLRLHDDLATLERVFSPHTPDLGSTKNPIDFTGQATPQDYDKALAAALKEPSCHTVLAVYCETALLAFDHLDADIAVTYAKYASAGKPIAFCLLGGEAANRCLAALRQAGVPAYGEIYTAVSCLGALHAHARRLESPTEEPLRAEIDIAAIERLLAPARAEGRHFLLAPEGYALLKALGLRAPETHVARTLEQALVHAGAMGYPVVLKIISPDIVHKTDAGGVALDLESRDEVIAGYEAIMRSCRQRRPDARILGVEVTRMVSSGAQVIIGARRDAAFGPIVMFGLGGVYVELLGDVAFRSIPLTLADILAMIKETRAHRLLLGMRGEPARDLSAVIDCVVRLAALIEACPGIADIEVNPLAVFAEQQGACAMDVRVALRE